VHQTQSAFQQVFFIDARAMTNQYVRLYWLSRPEAAPTKKAAKYLWYMCERELKRQRGP